MYRYTLYLRSAVSDLTDNLLWWGGLPRHVNGNLFLVDRIISSDTVAQPTLWFPNFTPWRNYENQEGQIKTFFLFTVKRVTRLRFSNFSNKPKMSCVTSLYRYFTIGIKQCLQTITQRVSPNRFNVIFNNYFLFIKRDYSAVDIVCNELSYCVLSITVVIIVLRAIQMIKLCFCDFDIWLDKLCLQSF